MARRLYPIGIQTFERVRRENLVYIDKTDLVYRLTHQSGTYFFLSRPRRFGKSLLVSTLKSYFEGKKELFKGLAIEKLEREWQDYPVLHFSMAGGKHSEVDELERYLAYILSLQEEKFGFKSDIEDANNRLTNLIKRAHEQTGKQVVVLIDEYDAPLLDVVHEEKNLNALRQVMRNFYSPLKDCEPYLRFVFLTGITKFSQMSIFSELNNIANISMRSEYAAICGITKEELLANMQEDINDLGDSLGLSPDETFARLQEQYDGYHFSWSSPDIFNPFSLLNCFEEKKLGAYWFSSGTPTYLINMMRKFGVQPTDIGEQSDAVEADFDAPTEYMESITPLFYQSGYFTVKGYDPDTELYTLGIPNREIWTGLFRSLLPNYLGSRKLMGNTTIAKMSVRIKKGDIDGALQMLRDFLATVPYCDNTHYEGHYQQMMYVIFALLTHFRILVEQRTPKGRTDITMETDDRIYVMELKFGKTAGEALGQIKTKDYAKAFAMKGKPVTLVGIGFDVEEERNITEWIVE